jgi:hypothetical protein
MTAPFHILALDVVGLARSSPNDLELALAILDELLNASDSVGAPKARDQYTKCSSDTGLYALYRRQGPRLAGLCLGFLPVFSMALHNWMFGRELVLFSSNAAHPLVLVMPPSAYVAAFHELVSLNFSGGNLARALLQIPNWLSGPAESYWTVPLNAAGVAILVYVVVRGRHFDPWLRLIGAAALPQHIVALFNEATPARTSSGKTSRPAKSCGLNKYLLSPRGTCAPSEIKS